MFRLFLLLCLLSTALSAEYYLSPNGSDDLPCDKDNPCKTLSHVMELDGSDLTVYYFGGTYAEDHCSQTAINTKDSVILMPYDDTKVTITECSANPYMENSLKDRQSTFNVTNLEFRDIPSFVSQTNGSISILKTTFDNVDTVAVVNGYVGSIDIDGNTFQNSLIDSSENYIDLSVSADIDSFSFSSNHIDGLMSDRSIVELILNISSDITGAEPLDIVLSGNQFDGLIASWMFSVSLVYMPEYKIVDRSFHILADSNSFVADSYLQGLLDIDMGAQLNTGYNFSVDFLNNEIAPISDNAIFVFEDSVIQLVSTYPIDGLTLNFCGNTISETMGTMAKVVCYDDFSGSTFNVSHNVFEDMQIRSILYASIKQGTGNNLIVEGNTFDRISAVEDGISPADLFSIDVTKSSVGGGTIIVNDNLFTETNVRAVVFIYVMQLSFEGNTIQVHSNIIDNCKLADVVSIDAYFYDDSTVLSILDNFALNTEWNSFFYTSSQRLISANHHIAGNRFSSTDWQIVKISSRSAGKNGWKILLEDNYFSGAEKSSMISVYGSVKDSLLSIKGSSVSGSAGTSLVNIYATEIDVVTVSIKENSITDSDFWGGLLLVESTDEDVSMNLKVLTWGNTIRNTSSVLAGLGRIKSKVAADKLEVSVRDNVIEDLNGGYAVGFVLDTEDSSDIVIDISSNVITNAVAGYVGGSGILEYSSHGVGDSVRVEMYDNTISGVYAYTNALLRLDITNQMKTSTIRIENNVVKDSSGKICGGFSLEFPGGLLNGDIDLRNNTFLNTTSKDGTAVMDLYCSRECHVDVDMDMVTIVNSTGFQPAVQIICEKDGVVRVANSIFESNRGINGASLGVSTNGSILVDNTIFRENFANVGPCLLIGGATVHTTLDNSLFDSNTADSSSVILFDALMGSLVFNSSNVVIDSVMNEEADIDNFVISKVAYDSVGDGSNVYICPSGYSYYERSRDDTSVMCCIGCSTNNYSTISGTNINDMKCYVCPEGARCQGQTEVSSVSGFWGSVSGTDGQITMYSCPSGYCTSDGISNSYDSCEDHRVGYLCSECEDGYTLTMSSVSTCIPEDVCKNNHYIYYVVMVLKSVAYSFLAYYFPHGANATFTNFVYFFQAFYIVFPDSSQMFSGQNKLSFAINLFLLRVDSNLDISLCAKQKLGAQGVVYLRIVEAFSFLVGYLVVASMIFLYRRVIRKERIAPKRLDPNAKRVKVFFRLDTNYQTKLVSGLLTVFLLSYMPIVIALSEALACISIRDKFGVPALRLYRAPTTVCFQKYQYVGFVLLVALGIVPIYAYIISKKALKKYAKVPYNLRAALYIFQKPFVPKFKHYRVFLMLSQYFLALFGTFVMNDNIRLFLISIVTLSVLMVQISLRPFRSRKENVLSLTLLVILDLISNASGTENNEFVMYATVVVTILIVVSLL